MQRKLTLREIADEYGTTPKTFSKLVKSKRIPHERLKRQYRFNLAVVEAHLSTVEEKSELPSKRVSLLKRGGNKYAEALGV